MSQPDASLEMRLDTLHGTNEAPTTSNFAAQAVMREVVDTTPNANRLTADQRQRGQQIGGIVPDMQQMARNLLERSEMPTTEEMYADILGPERAPAYEVPEGITATTAVRLGGRRLYIGQAVVELTPRETFLLNAFQMLPRGIIRSKQIFQLGFASELHPKRRIRTFGDAFKSLGEKLDTATQIVTLQKKGVGTATTYSLSEAFVITNDTSRLPEAVIAAQRLGLENEGEADAHDTPEGVQRRNRVIAAVALYRDHPEVPRRLAADCERRDLPGIRRDARGYLLDLASRYPLLDTEQEVALGTMLEAGLQTFLTLEPGSTPTPDQKSTLIDMAYAFERFYVSNMRLVVAIAQKYTGTIPLEELVQLGMPGLTDAIARFDHTRGFKFSTRATRWVQQAISRGVADTGRDIRLPVHMHDKWVKLREARRTLTQELEREPSPEELASVTDFDLDTVMTLITHGEFIKPSLDKKLDATDNGTTFGDTLPSPKNEIGQMLSELALTSLIEQAALTESELFILGLRYGLYHHRLFTSNGGVTWPASPLKFQDVANRIVLHFMQEDKSADTQPSMALLATYLGVSREIISQYERRALHKLRTTAGAPAQNSSDA
ncbi:MAG TPA: sigma-70 family RNA polymerase sigma factor [Candidatus Saccharimonadales bacterium]|nr:sigma-70 family RNA polymerase sigma factor [Candidatus Saccharimonadales bacterium]